MAAKKPAPKSTVSVVTEAKKEDLGSAMAKCIDANQKHFSQAIEDLKKIVTLEGKVTDLEEHLETAKSQASSSFWKGGGSGLVLGFALGVVIVKKYFHKEVIPLPPLTHTPDISDIKTFNQ